MIHRTAIVHPSAHVHPSSFVDAGVIIGAGVFIGERVHVGAYSVIGYGPPEHRGFYQDFNDERSAPVYIKDGVIIWQFVSIHRGTRRLTEIGEGSAIQNHAHIGHDCVIGRETMIGSHASLGGFVDVMDGAQVCGRSNVHQKSIIGAYSMLSPTSFLKGDIPPGELWIGNPARPSGQNEIGLSRNNMDIHSCLERYAPRYLELKRKRDEQ